MISSFSIDGHYDDGKKLLLGCDDKPITIKLADMPAVTYWAKLKSMASDGTPTFKLLPMDRA